MIQVEGRWVRKGTRIYHDSHCLYCGVHYGIGSGEPRACRITICMVCDSVQCMVNGLSRGTYGICGIGLLPGWSGTDRPCSYKGCQNRAIARADGKLFRCREHLERGKWKGYVSRRLAERDRCFTWVGPSTVPLLGEG